MLEKLRYRLGIDMGSTSIGWAMILLDEQKEPCGVKRMGVRIFPDGRDDKSKEPLSVSRRMKRGARRNRDRYLERMCKLYSALIENGFFPRDAEERKAVFAEDPYYLRARALDHQLSKAQIARALHHLAKRRGFKSNRKVDKDGETTAFKSAINNLAERLDISGSRTIGEYLYTLRESHSVQHMRPALKFRYDAKEFSETERIFPRRDMVEHEFDLIWDHQAGYYPEMSPEIKENIRYAIFYQEPLWPTIKGKCPFETDQTRAPKAHPLFQEFRILQDLNNLKLEEVFDQSFRSLTQTERDFIYNKLQSTDTLKLEAVRKQLFKAKKDDYKFNYETENRKDLRGNQTLIAFNNKNKPELSAYWNSLDYEAQINLVELLVSEIPDQELLEELKSRNLNNTLVDQLLNLSLPSEFGSLSVKALNKILPYMRQGRKYSEACEDAGYDHSGFYNGVVYQDGDLPYYGELLPRSVLPLGRRSEDPDADEYGKINNPTVHIALNQLRKIVNSLEKLHGAPEEIVLELARDLKMGTQEKERYESKLRKLTKDNIRIAEELQNLGIVNNSENRARYRLWEELAPEALERRCIYSGTIIPVNELFSPKFEIEHILPKSRTYDDSISNKTISLYSANRYKGERSPWEAFGNSQDGYDWEAIVSRASKLPENKRRRFLKDAMSEFSDESQVLSRMLNDTRYMSRVAAQYMQYVCGNDKVWVVTGQQTALIRKKWGLEKILSNTEQGIKNRQDHRHHAIDAFVIGMISRSMIKRFSSAVKNSRERFLEKMPDPYPGFDREEFAAAIDKLKVSFKPDQVNPDLLRSRIQTAGALMEETAYGFMGPDPDNPKMHIYTLRNKAENLTLKDIDKVIDKDIRRHLEILAEGISDDKAFKQRLKPWLDANNIKRIKLMIVANPASMIGIKDRSGKIYKYMASGSNLYSDIYCTKPWDSDAKWGIEIVSAISAHQPGFTPKWKRDYPMAKLIMRLYKNDIVALDDGYGGREFRRVKKMTKGSVFLREINTATKDKNLEDIGEQHGPSKLKELNARKAGIDIIGRAYDPGAERKDADS